MRLKLNWSTNKKLVRVSNWNNWIESIFLTRMEWPFRSLTNEFITRREMNQENELF